MTRDNNRKPAALASAATTALACLALLSNAPTPALAAGLGYIPPATQGCPQNVLVKLEAQSRGGGGLLGGASSWFGGPPSVSGRATVLNGESYSVPIQNVQVMIFPANSPVSPVYADCWGIGSGQRVPSNPIPYQYGRASCTFEASLPTNGPSAGARNWQQARAMVTLTNGAKCYSEMTPISSSGGGGGGWPWGGGGGGNWIIGSSGGGGGGGRGIGSSGPGSSGGGGGLGSTRMVGAEGPDASSSSSGGGGGKAPTMLGGANPTGGRKMLGLSA